jgi:hypothetical protein
MKGQINGLVHRHETNTNFVNSSGVSINIIKNYGQIDLATLKTACERFCKTGEVDAESRAKQNNTMMVNCLANLLSLAAKVRLLTYSNEYTFDGVEYTLVMYKVIMPCTLPPLPPLQLPKPCGTTCRI